MYRYILSEKGREVKGESAKKARELGLFKEFRRLPRTLLCVPCEESEREAKSGLSGPVACRAHQATPNHVSCPLSTENGAMNLDNRIFTQKEPVNRGF